MQKTDQKTPDTKAVAIQGQPTKDGTQQAPTITAKGTGFNAEKILDIAFKEGVKVREDKALVDMLEAFDVESPIPLEALYAVNLILERVYLEENRLKGSPRQQQETQND